MGFSLRTTALLGLALTTIAACGDPDDTGEIVLDDPVELPVPDLEGVVLEDVFRDAFSLMAMVDLRPAWAGHVDSLELRQDGCPDLFNGNPDVEDIDINSRNKGSAWMDFCSQSDDTLFGGFEYWEIDVNIDGDEDTAEGKTIEASRLLFGDGVVGRGDDVLFEFDGEGTDALTVTNASDGYSAWTYTSRVEGTVTGTLPFDTVTSGTPGGYRTDLYRRATGGGAGEALESRGNVYLFEHRLQTRFDSIGLDLELKGPEGAGPDDCLLEPRGWIAVRDSNAFWYDLVFEPRYDGDPDDPDYPNDPYSNCDGCGTLYVRGLEQEGIEVCLDLSFLWEGSLTPPDVEDFAFTLRDPGEGS